MKKKLLTFGIPALAMFAAAAVLLAGGMVGSTRAALSYYSENYLSDIEVQSIGITLTEDENDIAHRNYTGAGTDGWTTVDGTLLSGVKEKIKEGSFQIGKKYGESLAVKNSGVIPVYVRAVVYRYWTNAEGKKQPTLNPAYIDLGFTGGKWVKDEKESTEERSVWYYTLPVEAGAPTENFVDSIRIDPVVNSKVSVNDTSEYVYNDMTFQLEVEVDAVQAEYGEDAIKSAWGCENVSISGDGTLSVN